MARKIEFKKYLLFAIPAIVYFIMRFSVIGRLGGFGEGERYYVEYNPIEKIYAFFVTFAQYMEKLFFPFPMYFFHAKNVQSNLLNHDFIVSFVFFIAFFALFFVFKKRNKNVLSFCMLWMFVLILPALMFLESIGENVLAERYLFVPGAGFAIIVAYFLNWLIGIGKKSKAVVTTALVLAILVSWPVVYFHNETWKDMITFFRYNLFLRPNSSLLRESLALEYRKNGNEEMSKKELEKILKLDPDWKYISNVYTSLGNYYKNKGDFDLAETLYQEAIEASEKNKLIEDYKPYNNLGALYYEKEQYLKSILYFCKALQKSPNSSESQGNFDRLASMIENVTDETFVFFYQDLTSGGVFKKSGEKRVQYRSKVCIGNSCYYLFNPKVGENETFLPFLAVAKSFYGEIIKVEDYYLSSQANTIALKIEKQQEDIPVIFILPSCEGVYYEAVTADENK